MTKQLLSSMAIAAWAVLNIAPAQAQNTAEALAPVERVVDADKIKGWIADLADPDFPVREAAEQNLRQAGIDALKPVVRALESDNAEVRRRAAGVLKAWHQSDDEALKTAAKDSLERAAKSDHPNASQAAGGVLADLKREAEELAKQEEQNATSRAGGVRAIALAPAIVGPIRADGDVRSVRYGEKDGVKTVTIEEKDRKIEIAETKDEITVSITEGSGDDAKTKSYKAKNFEELRKQSEEAAKYYRSYAGRDRRGARGDDAPARGIRVVVPAERVEGVPIELEIERIEPKDAKRIEIAPQPAKPKRADKD